MNHPVELSQSALPNAPIVAEPNPEHVLSLLEGEIQEIQSAETRNGWNLWAILGAIGALIWLLTGELATGTYEWVSIGKLVIAESLVIDGTRWLFNFIATRPAKSDARFHWSSYLFGTSRPQAVIEIARSIGVLLAAFVSRSFPWYLLTTLSVCYGLHIFLMTNLLILSFKPFAVANARNRWAYFFMVTPYATLVISFGFLLPRIRVSQFLMTFRVSALIVALSYLSVMFGHALRTSVAKPVLMDIRRRLVARKITSSDAMKSSEIALGGMEVADALRSDVLEIISLLERMDEQTKNALLSLHSIESNLPASGDDPSVWENKGKTIVSLKAGYKFFLTERQKLAIQHQTKAQEFFGNAARVRIVPTATATIDEYSRILQTRAATTDGQFNSLVERETEVQQKLAAAFPAR